MTCNPYKGIAASATDLPDAIPFALDHGCDLLVLEGNPGIGSIWQSSRARLIFRCCAMRSASSAS